MSHVLDQVRSSIAERSCALLSLDIFDTILWRRVPRPADAFVLLAESLRASGACPEWITGATFRHMRILAEQEARREPHGPEVSLYDIWRKMPLSSFAAPLEQLVAAEVALERELTVVDFNIAELITHAAEHDIPVVLVSDTYFTDEQLRHLLDRPELAHLAEARLFRSLEYRVDKANGLWPVVLDALKVRPEQIWHVGDNEVADVIAPRREGLRCMHYVRIDGPLDRVLRREHQPMDYYGPVDPLLDPVEGDFGMTSLRAKVVGEAPDDLARAVATAWRYGATVLGPVLTGFAEWVVSEADAAGTKTVWCPMREGELLAELINEAARARASKLEAKPLWLSRHVTSVAMLDEINSETLSELARRSFHLTVGGLLDILHLRPGDVPAVAGQVNTVLDNSEVLNRVAAALTESPLVRNKLNSTVTKARERLITALRNAGALDDPDLTLIDLGWAGTIQRQLGRVLELARIPVVPAGLYLATEDRSARTYQEGFRAQGFLAQAGVPHEVSATLSRSPEVLEQCVNALCGSLVDFTDEGDPVLGPVVDGPAQAAERKAAQDGIRAFQQVWNRYAVAHATWPSLGTAAASRRLANILVSALQAPTSEEAQVFGNWEHEDNFGSTVVTRVIPEDLAAAIAYLSPNDLDDLQLRDAFWPRLVAASDPHLAAQVEAVHLGHVDKQVFEPSGAPFETRVRWRDSAGEMYPGPSRRVRINHNGLSFARLTVSADDVQDVALSIPGRPAIVRIDWIEAQLFTDSPDPVVLRWDSPEDLAQLVFSQCRWLGGTLVEFDWPQSAIWLNVGDRAGAPVTSAQISVAFAMLPRSTSGLEPHLPSASSVVRLAHRAVADYQSHGVLGVATGLRATASRRLAVERQRVRGKKQG